jgi:hypothetical protein
MIQYSTVQSVRVPGTRRFKSDTDDDTNWRAHMSHGLEGEDSVLTFFTKIRKQ